jgi:hypothetical protein
MAAPSIKQLSYVFLRPLALTGILGLAGAAHAMSLGELKIQSHLGEPFLGTVRYTATRGDDVVPLCIRTRYVSNGAAVIGVPELVDPRIDVRPESSGGTIVIRTARPVEEPLVRLSLSVNCGPSAVFNREFMVALDPPRADAPVLRGAYGAPERPQAGIAPGPAGSASAPDAAITPPAAASGPSAAISPPQSGASAPAQRPRRQRAPATVAAPAGGRAATLPYEPGVTPPPGRRGAVRPRVEERERGPKYRLTLSRPGSDEPNPTPLLRGSDTLASLALPAMAAVTPQQRENLRAEWRARMSDPLAENQKMQDDVTRLGGAVNDLKAQIAAIQKERDAARADDARRIAQLEADKRNLAAWLNGLALALGFIGCVAVMALVFWSWRRRSESKAARARRVTVDLTPPEPERVEPTGLEDESGVAAWRPEEEIPVHAPAPVAEAAPPEAPVKPAKKPMGRPAPAGPRVATPRPTPPAAPKAVVEDEPTITKTVELPHKPGAVPPVEDFYANPPRGGDEPEFSLDEPPQPAVSPPPAPPAPMALGEMETAEPSELPPITFELSPTETAIPPAPVAAPGPGPADHGDPIEFSLDGAIAPQAAAPAPEMPAAPASAPVPAPAAEAADPFGDVPEPPPSPAHDVTFVPSASSGPSPTMLRMKTLVDELAAAHLAMPQAPAAPPEQVVATGAHRTLDIDLGGDGDSEMRAQLYRQEFELKLFPEIVHGQAKLKVPQSIISLARTYYQEDFDTNRAINLLEYAADRTPDPQRVRLALLEILRMEGMAREYVAVARGFSSQFPGADEWETVAAYGRLLAPDELLFGDADVTGYDLNMPSMWLGSTLDMTRYVLAQDLHDAMHGPGGVEEEA